MPKTLHIPVLISEVIEKTKPQLGNKVIDATLGLGGHAEAFLKKIGTRGQLTGLDADERNLELAKKRFSKYKNIKFIQDNFRNIGKHCKANSADIIIFDLGISSPHLDEANRGFSFQKDGPLDMRLDTQQPLNAAGILNGFSENKIAEILWKFGEIRSSRKIAAKIIATRKNKKFTNTQDLVEIIQAKSLLAQIFQALRIAVNDELETLKEGLSSALKILKPGGRIAVISFHSLEDRIVKNFFRQESKDCICEKSEPICSCKHKPIIKIINKKPIRPSPEELHLNPRSRSALLRIAEKI